MPANYSALLRRPGAAAFVTAGFIGRLPLAMISLGIVLLITATGGSYALAGAMSATYALATALISPFGSRWVDRSGQTRVLPILAVTQSLFVLLFAVAVAVEAPRPVQFATLIVAGASAPNIGSSIRARWAAVLSDAVTLRSAFALEAVVDEVVFILGPPLVTTIAVSLSPEFALGVCVALVLVGSAWLAYLRDTQPRLRSHSQGHDHQRMLSGGFAIVVAVMVLMGGIFGSFEVTTVAFTHELGQPGLTGPVLAVYAFGSMIAGLILGGQHIAVGLDRQLLVSSTVLAVVTLPMPIVGSLIPLVLVSFLAGMSVSPVLILAVTIVEHLVPPGRLTEALTVSTSGIGVGLAVAAPLSGAIIDRHGAHNGYLVMAGCAVTALLVTLITLPILRRSLLGGAPFPQKV